MPRDCGQGSCELCSVVYLKKDKRQRFCSYSCAAKVNNLKFPRKHLKEFKRPKKLYWFEDKRVEKPLCACGSVRYKYAKKMPAL